MTTVGLRKADSLSVGRQVSASARDFARRWRTIGSFWLSGTAGAAAAVVIVAGAATYPGLVAKIPGAVPLPPASEAERNTALPSSLEFSGVPVALSRSAPSPVPQQATGATPEHELELAKSEEDRASAADRSLPPLPAKRNLSYLRFYAYAEIPLPEKPADLVLDSMKDVPIGTSVEEIKRASEAFGMNFSFMKAVAKIESDFDPKQRTGSYIGLFQLSRYEFQKYGSGDILNPRDNAVAAADKFLTEATLFEWYTGKKPTFSDLYLIHQQGWQGAAEHVGHPERIAWKSMCATDEGMEKGEKWCRRAVWGNTLPTVKQAWKSVERLTSGAFVKMWRDRVDLFYARYSEATADEAKR